MNWYRVFTNNGWRVFSEDLRVAYLSKVSSGRSVPEPCIEAGIDLPGMIVSTRSIQEVTVDGLTVHIPSTDFEDIRAILRSMPIEMLPGGVECVKLRGYMEGLVLTPAQRKELLREMEYLLPAVMVIAAEEDRIFLEATRDLPKYNVFSKKTMELEQLESEGKSDGPKPN